MAAHDQVHGLDGYLRACIDFVADGFVRQGIVAALLGNACGVVVSVLVELDKSGWIGTRVDGLDCTSGDHILRPCRRIIFRLYPLLGGECVMAVKVLYRLLTVLTSSKLVVESARVSCLLIRSWLYY